MRKNRFINTLLVIMLCGSLYANNLQITNLQIDPSGNSATFDISWENSWYFSNAPDNWDAAWVFMKYYDCSDPFTAKWEHLQLSDNSSDHSVTGGVLQVDAVSDRGGVFLRRMNTGTGNISAATVTVVFNGSPGFDPNTVNFKVFGIEMVAVLQGDFETGGFFGVETTSTDETAHHSFNNISITSEATIPAATLSTLGTAGAGLTTSWRQYHPEIGPDFPKGWSGFYIMKYQITQEQYVGFLNTLSYQQQINRSVGPNRAVNNNGLHPTNNATINYRNAVKIETQGISPTPATFACNLNNDGVFNDVDDGQNIACNYLTWHDLLAYLDWAALRPMTELEYEKACRGPIPASPGEFAWGNNFIVQARSNDLTNAGEGSEISNASASIPSGSGIAAYGYTSGGPLRVGFPAMANTDRLEAGASYWGVMELSGNLFEQCYSVGNRNQYQNTSFDGTLGDGNLDINGNSDTPNWGANHQHSILRGGSFYESTDVARVGSRYYAYYVTTASRLPNGVRHATNGRSVGGRGVRQF